jgi:lipopolysaccharide export system protein LptA
MCCKPLAALWGAVLALSWLASVSAEPPAPATASETKPMAITSRSMTVKSLDQRVVFDHEVTISKGDMELNADRVEVILARPAAPDESAGLFGAAGPNILSEDNIERIEADGRVKVVQGKKTATADHAVYHRAEETIILTGHPETSDEGGRIQGSRITILLKEQRTIVEESRVVIFPEATNGNVVIPQPPQTRDGG